VTSPGAGEFSASLSYLVDPHLASLAAQLDLIPGLASGERAAIIDGCAAALRESALRKVSRVLDLELNAARITGQLRAADSAGRWDEFLSLSASSQFWRSLTAHYPTLLDWLATMLAGRCAAARMMAARFAADRGDMSGLIPAGQAELTAVRFAAGDSHRGGQTVAVLELAAAKVVYKPRSVRVDAALSDFLADVIRDVPADTRIRVPAVVAREGYGWAEFAIHRYCVGDAELASFYRGIGHWLAILRLLGGTDLHAENLIACGPVPVVVDCETLFSPVPRAAPSGLGLAIDRASGLINETVLRTGILPGRGIALGARGAGIPAAGSLPGQQPADEMAVILDVGRDTGLGAATAAAYCNRPSPQPALARFWDQVLAGFADVTATLRAMDTDGGLEPLLRRFADCPVRMVLRASEAYAEIGRMLWHPVSLHEPGAAEERAVRLLASMADSVPGAPADPQVIAAEVADLLNGDVPFFATTPAEGQLTGPDGTTWLPRRDLISDALTSWRQADLELDGKVIRATLVSAFLNDGWMPTGDPMPVGEPSCGGLEQRRRDLAAMLVRQIRDAAIGASDGTVTWIAPVLNATAWAVQPLSPDLYSGLPGMAIVLAAYQREAALGRAEQVGGLDELLTAVLRTMRAEEDFRERVQRSRGDMRSRPPGGFVGLGSQIWVWLTLERWGMAGADGLGRARLLARQLPAAVAAGSHELLAGQAGAIVPLLQLSAVTGEERWANDAVATGDRLIAAARQTADGVFWPSSRWPDGLGGCANGVTGIGWALARLSLVTSAARFAAVAHAAFAFEERLYDPAAGGWLDLRQPGQISVAWCHGAVGIGLLAADLASRGWPCEPDLIRRAARATERFGFGWNHTLCHGDLGCWELLDVARTGGHYSDAGQRSVLDARVIGSLERNGPVSGLARDAFAPGLLPGIGGMVYQLLRMGQRTDLPSVLTLGDPC
jgi:type 2 lantibiotic biosynthesis protein LanM